MKRLLIWGTSCLLAFMAMAGNSITGAGDSELAKEVMDIRVRLQASEKAGNRSLMLKDLRRLRDLQVQYGSTDSALISCLRVVELSGISTNRLTMAEDWQILSQVSRQAGDLNNAIDAVKRQLLILKGLGDPSLENTAHLGLLDLLAEAGRFDDFRHQSEQLSQAFQEQHDDQGLIRVLYRQGEVLASQGRAADAISQLHMALRHVDRLEDKKEIGQIWFSMAQAKADLAKWDAALSAYNTALEFFPRAPHAQPELYGLLGRIYEGQGRLQEALLSERQQGRMKDSLLSSGVAGRMASLQTLYGVRMHGQDMARLQEANASISDELGQALGNLRMAQIGLVVLAFGLLVLIMLQLKRAAAHDQSAIPDPTFTMPAPPASPYLADPAGAGNHQPALGRDVHFTELLINTLCQRDQVLPQGMTLQEIRSRMSIMRLVQENIRKSELLGSLNLRAHLTSLANTLYQESGLTGKAEFQLELGNIGDVEINDLVPLSLLVSELLRVSIGHAQEGHYPCAVAMTLGRLDSNQLELRYDDHTSSINPQILEAGTATGALVLTWATVLGGSIRLLKGEATTFQFTFRAAPGTAVQRAS